jgi:adenylate cyclase
MTLTRRLAAIMAADVAGFSAVMERDEEGTFAQVQELRRKIGTRGIGVRVRFLI